MYQHTRFTSNNFGLLQKFRNFDYMSPWEGFENELIGDEKSKDKDN